MTLLMSGGLTIGVSVINKNTIALTPIVSPPDINKVIFIFCLMR